MQQRIGQNRADRALTRSNLRPTMPTVPEWRNGRRGGLKIHCPHGRVSSTLTSGTNMTRLCARPQIAWRAVKRGDLVGALSAAARESLDQSGPGLAPWRVPGALSGAWTPRGDALGLCHFDGSTRPRCHQARGFQALKFGGKQSRIRGFRALAVDR